jgi:hypothetical protein
MYSAGHKQIKSELSFGKHKYREHKRRLLSEPLDKTGNKIEFKLSFEEWYDIWKKSGHWEERGRKAGQYCMSRIDDIGHYEVGNVFIQLHSKNVHDAKIGSKINPEQLKKLCDGRDRYFERRGLCPI